MCMHPKIFLNSFFTKLYIPSAILFFIYICFHFELLHGLICGAMIVSLSVWFGYLLEENPIYFEFTTQRMELENWGTSDLKLKL